ncbi:unnamed protein product [Ceratitis capitata]|uniref:(Mediterranean fruit fly) hypothetical protein n=1 Tax=Ceratitis capitata TaxID=7213 RepID=A0A811UXX3_CERCA|nr:unnamed protein product [Ceratitis capitata]
MQSCYNFVGVNIWKPHTTSIRRPLVMTLKQKVKRAALPCSGFLRLVDSAAICYTICPLPLNEIFFLSPAAAFL